MYSYYNSCFFKKDCSYRNNCGIWLHDADLEHSIMKERCSYVLLPIFMFWLICVCFRDVLQPTVYLFPPGLIRLPASLYSKCTVFTENLCSVLVMYKKVLSLTKSIMDKSVFSVLVVFLWPLILFDFRCYKYCTAHFGKRNLCTLWSLALAKKSCNNINYSHVQVSRLRYFLWLWFYIIIGCIFPRLSTQSFSALVHWSRYLLF